LRRRGGRAHSLLKEAPEFRQRKYVASRKIVETARRAVSTNSRDPADLRGSRRGERKSSAKGIFIGWLPDDLEAIQRAGTILTGGAANGLYTLAGIILTVSARGMPTFLRFLAWAVWFFGLALTASALAGSILGMMISTTGLMALFCPWTWLMGMKLK
jgi:hypothetical protein